MKPKHWLVFILLGAIWSSSFMWIKIAVQEIGPITLVAFRVSFGLLFGLAVMVIQRVQWPNSFRAWFPNHIAESVRPTARVCRSGHFDGQGYGRLARFCAWTGCRHIGIRLLCGQRSLRAKDNGEYAGDFAKRRALVSASTVMWLATFLVERPVEIPESATTWVALLRLGILGSGLAFVMAYYLIHEIGPTRTSMVTYLFPLGGVILGVAFLHEELSWQLITGAIFIIAGHAVANWQPAKTGDYTHLTAETLRAQSIAGISQRPLRLGGEKATCGQSPG